MTDKSDDELKIYKAGEEPEYTFKQSEEEWKKQLSPKAYGILRQKDTEYPHTGEYNHVDKQGTFYSKATGQELFRTDQKYESHCGWPSFYNSPYKDNMVFIEDNSLGMSRVEVVDSLSGSHLGHIFPDGPQPTGLRYCINSDALVFVPDGEEMPQWLKDLREKSS
ncbi:peptide-methionine (R)-S-oxide reductase MsrB [Spirochaeta cellobiosiphila]|uniref:peptide-methionine (R)-S-oxide reductase MsrB n=1 Tax=Spirochaeta cellobiosiphila TaxID=504483 RepID=UPI0003FE6C00|nr:peptide-methionine (R)-S-oxide reductase MsrB [Spirochaeta cellobiosiphila]